MNSKIELMRYLLTIIVVFLTVAGCSTTPNDVRSVWMPSTSFPAKLPPPGFRVTPMQALKAARDSRMISLKHIWHIYADSHYYYVHDTFLGDSSKMAYDQGVRIDGQTGEVARR